MSDTIRVDGHCYCGAIAFEVSIPEGNAPIFTAYCHCDSCRRAHSAPLYQVVCIDASSFDITTGAELLTEFQKPGGRIVRAFCSQCGSRILNRFPEWTPEGRTPLVFFPSLLRAEQQQDLPEAFRPKRDLHPEESVLDHDALERHLESLVQH